MRARAQSLGFTCESGLFARPERVVVTVIGLIFGGVVLYGVVFLLAILTNLTALQRIREVWLQGRAQRLAIEREAEGRGQGGRAATTSDAVTRSVRGDRRATPRPSTSCARSSDRAASRTPTSSSARPGSASPPPRALLAAALLPEAPLHRHPDYWEDDRIKPLSINEIRLLPDKPPEFHELSLQAFLNLKPAVGTRRVALVANVGRLRDQDQGVLLKTLEEPHPHRVIILTTPSLNPFVVLPTVVSRCQRVFFHPVPAAEIEKLLRAQGRRRRNARTLLADLARGRPGLGAARRRRRRRDRAPPRLDAPAGGGVRRPGRRAAAASRRSSTRSQMAWRRSEGDDEDPALFAIASWQIELRRRMLASRGREQGRWARLVELSYDTLGYLEQNVSPRLALETFLLECRKAS